MAAVHLPKGTRDFLPETMRYRLTVLGQVREVFAQFGFQPLDTPAFERMETLLGKYGEDERLIFKILKRGAGGLRGECDLALRYDLTVPLARVIAMNPGLRMPFKRYHIAPVWRADRPGKGRFREFLQCDVDIVGCVGNLAEAECLAVAAAALDRVGLVEPRFRINDRRVLKGIAALVGALEQERSFLVAIDKLDKIGRDGVDRELAERGFGPESTRGLWDVLRQLDDNAATLAHLRARLETVASSVVREEALAGVEALTALLPLAEALGVPAERLEIDPTLARGLDYYTGPVYEIAVEGYPGAMGGGGRYDGLIGSLGGRDLPAVGISLGIERILDVLMEQSGRGDDVLGPQVMVSIFDEAHRSDSLRVARQLRAAGIRVDLFLDVVRLKKQLKYAASRDLPFVALIGPEEAEKDRLMLRDLRTGGQRRMTVDEAAEWIASGSGLPREPNNG